MTLEELRYHRWEPLSVVLDKDLISKFVPLDGSKVPAEVYLNLECGRVVETLLSCSDSVVLAKTDLKILKDIPVGSAIDISTKVADLRSTGGASFVTVEQEYSFSGRAVATLTQILAIKS